MSTEPERHIEKQLRAYANKRRAEAGAPFKMHPATRRLLHGEIARKTPQTRGRFLLFTRAFFQIWPRFAYVIVFLMLGITVLIFRVIDHKESMELANQTPPSTVSSVNETRGQVLALKSATEISEIERKVDRQALMPSELTQLKNGLDDNKLAAAPQVAERKKAEGLNKPAANFGLQPPVALARKEATGNPSDVNNAPTPAATPTSPAFYYAGKETERLNSERSPLVSATQGFARVDELSKTVTDGFKSRTILLSFQMQRTGEEVRVIDGDGSVYDGYLQTADATLAQPTGSGKYQAASQEKRNKVLTAAQTAKLEDKSGDETNQVYFFRVVGTNQNLKQQVIFSGHLLANTGNTDFSKDNLSTRATKQFQLPAQNQAGAPLLNSRINGTAVIGGSNTIEIEAIPLAPR